MLIAIFAMLWLLCGGVALLIGSMLVGVPEPKDVWSVRLCCLLGPVFLSAILLNPPSKSENPK